MRKAFGAARGHKPRLAKAREILELLRRQKPEPLSDPFSDLNPEFFPPSA